MDCVTGCGDDGTLAPRGHLSSSKRLHFPRVADLTVWSECWRAERETTTTKTTTTDQQTHLTQIHKEY